MRGHRHLTRVLATSRQIPVDNLVLIRVAASYDRELRGAVLREVYEDSSLRYRLVLAVDDRPRSIAVSIWTGPLAVKPQISQPSKPSVRRWICPWNWAAACANWRMWKACWLWALTR